MCNVAVLEPVSYKEETKESGWIKAMEVEMAMIKKNEVWELVERPVRKKVIGIK